MIDLDSYTPSTQDIGLFHKLCQDMSDIFNDKFNRNGQFIDIMKNTVSATSIGNTLGTTHVMAS